VSYRAARNEGVLDKWSDIGFNRPKGSIRYEGKYEAIDTLSDADLTSNARSPSIVYRVCALNIAGMACTTRTAYVPPAGAVQPSSIPKGDLMLPSQAVQDTNRAVPTTLPQDNGVVALPATTGGNLATPPTGHSNNCRSGYVWRAARDGDLVCVTPAARERVALENAEAAGHVDPSGAYGVNSCVAGFVWREAFDGDIVCVTPAARALATQENAEAVNRRADSDDAFRNPR
jgi:hypothetical protein